MPRGKYHTCPLCKKPSWTLAPHRACQMFDRRKRAAWVDEANLKASGLGEGITVKRYVPSTESWWLNLNGDFYDVARLELPRMAKGSGTNYKAAIQEY